MTPQTQEALNNRDYTAKRNAYYKREANKMREIARFCKSPRVAAGYYAAADQIESACYEPTQDTEKGQGLIIFAVIGLIIVIFAAYLIANAAGYQSPADMLSAMLTIFPQ